MSFFSDDVDYICPIAVVLELFCQNTPFAHILAIPSIKTPPTFFIWKTTIANEFLLGFFLVFRKILF